MKKILVAPLNWGLGHVTRCMPIIDELRQQGAEVCLASDGRALLLLQKEYPNLTTFELPAYNIRYGTGNMVANIAPQMPKILHAMWQEKQVLDKIIHENDIHAVISDNRFGCYSQRIPSVFVTHQINLKVPALLGIGTFAKWNNRRLIKRYHECWIPDFEGENNLAGSLAHGYVLPKAHYVGALSRMRKFDIKKRYDLIAVLSGPEPQRTFFEEKIIQQVSQLPYHTLIVKGKTDGTNSIEKLTTQKGNIETVAYLTKQALNEAILASDVIITRSGYSTIMDLATLAKRQVILVPTPGQTEQEYLAERFYNKNIFLQQAQEELDIKSAIAQLKGFKGLNVEMGGQKLTKVIERFLAHLS